MKKGKAKHIIWAGLALAMAAHAQTCEEVVVFDGNTGNGTVEESSWAFPEAPEWKANWGNFGTMQSPYIRLSGIKTASSDWTGVFAFDKLPLHTNGGNLKISVRTTEQSKFGIWLESTDGQGSVKFFEISANTTKDLEIPVNSLVSSNSSDVKKIGIGLFGVPANHYTTLFIDNIKFTCAGSSLQSEETSTTAEAKQSGYIYADVTPNSPVRNGASNSEPVKESKKRFSDTERAALSQMTSSKFVVTEIANNNILNFRDSKNLTPEDSRKGWYKSLFAINKGRLQDSVIANPKNLFLEAEEFSASTGYTTIPVLIADLDYSVKYFSDTTLTNYTLEDASLLLAGLPASHVEGSKVTFVYDPYYTATTRETLPSLQICVDASCKTLNPKTEADFEFNSAGVQEVSITLKSGTNSTKQTLTLEVK